jgi:hypothetical protein
MPDAHFALVASDDARGLPIRLDLRGFCTPAGAGRIRIEIDGRSSELTPGEEGFYLTLPAALNATGAPTRVIVTLDLPEPADGAAAMLALDSIDVGLPEETGGEIGDKGSRE